ncbi:MAG: ribosomal protein S18-alanine N-acetyltransferase [bacterium]|nr:ribosomal protein S18-alanine N-acetyltransferase [bacterium]
MSAPDPVFTVRPGRPEDLAQVERIERRCFDDAWSRDTLYGELLSDRMRLCLMADRNGTVGGYLMAWRVVDRLHVLNIAVDSAYQRSGLGTLLLLEAVRDGASRGQLEITLEVRASNGGARSFYRRHSFEETGLRPRYYSDNGEDAVVMTARLADVVAAAETGG